MERGQTYNLCVIVWLHVGEIFYSVVRADLQVVMVGIEERNCKLHGTPINIAHYVTVLLITYYLLLIIE